MKRWTVSLVGCADTTVAADIMTIENGALIFWRGKTGEFSNTIHVTFADGTWSRVEAMT